ncbi:ribosome maturation factor RimM [Lyngbya confervoides]|uniref:Ribosome maturation factor RimM n=1 Tax=Lyngbya confervoides BDU141951 TaxID=1574623 RepID=A0ABD4T152_9CYAN|nr:ribosome maturation factor RimM [Lyngbya confervoides]MCM1982304.1 ribosome maturation factor RimM [Lyngbya confervoides BDU141951]
MDSWIEIGKIVAPQGLRGEVRVYPDSDFPERFLSPGKRWIRSAAAESPRPLNLTQGRRLESKNLYVLKFAEINTRTEAEALRGLQILVEAGDRLPLGPGEFYLMDLIGLAVFDHQSQQEIGLVTSLINAGNDLLEIQLCTPTSPKVLVPFVTEFFPVINLPEGRLEIDPVPGLLPEGIG